jgi:hypothetical protein
MTMSKIALFAFALSSVLGAGFTNANAAPRYTGAFVYRSVLNPGAIIRSPEDALFERAKGGQGY